MKGGMGIGGSHVWNCALACLLLGPVAQAQDVACDAPTDTAQLSRLLADAELAFTRLDIDAFNASTDALNKQVPCLQEQMPRSLAAEIHRYVGLKAVLSRDFDSAAMAFAAARSVEPQYRFPASLVPDGNPIHDVYSQFDMEAASDEEVPPPAQGQLKFDGTVGVARSTSWPTIVQLVDDEGSVTATVYVYPGDIMPSYPPRVAGEPAPDPFAIAPPPPRETKSGPNVPLLATAGGAIALSGVFAGLAASSEATFWNESTPDSELPGLRGRINTFVALSAVTGTVAVGSGVAGIALTGTW